ncbi:MAG: hypothetical protein JW811_06370 [Clostridiales bacterium]|nr:hypothetical protein [Clostridiales bacterium]
MKKRTPEFDNLLCAFKREVPSRPTLFELFMNMPLYEAANGRRFPGGGMLGELAFTAEAFAGLGYDYVTAKASAMAFPTRGQEHLDMISLNDGGMVHDWESFERYPWPDPDGYDCSHLRDIKARLPGNMKLMVMGPGGVLENVTAIVGYETLCYLLYEEPELVEALFAQVGRRLLRYYERALDFDTVGFLCSNDDWGFNTQTFLSPESMRQYVFPWHKRYADLAHEAGRPILLHSCGNLRQVMADVVSMGFDAKHSFEDGIQPVEEAYEQWHGSLCIAGGIDVDFICRESEDVIMERIRTMMERTGARGGYLVGTGNSVPAYMPQNKYLAMVREAIGYDPLA